MKDEDLREFIGLQGALKTLKSQIKEKLRKGKLILQIHCKKKLC